MRIKGFIRRLTYDPKHAKPTDENIFQLLLPSIIGIAVCMVCLAGMTWAWFTASVTTPPQTITAASYDVTVSIDNEDISPENGQYTLPDGEHTVTLTAAGNASTGYCKIVIGNETYYTLQFPNPKEKNPLKEFTFKVNVSKATKMTVVPIWGTYTGEDVWDGTLLDLSAPPSDEQNQTVNDTPPQDETESFGKNTEKTYTVKEGDTLWKIAQSCDGITAADIAAYNGLDGSAPLQIGQILNIPSADDVRSEKPTNSVSTQSESESSKPASMPQAEEAPDTQEPSAEPSLENENKSSELLSDGQD